MSCSAQNGAVFSRARTPLEPVPRRVRVHRVHETSGALRRITFRDAAPTVHDDGRAAGPGADGPGGASLATLLWLQRCRSAGLQVPLLRLAGWGALCAVLCVGAATLAIR